MKKLEDIMDSTTQYVITKYTGELRHEPDPGDVVDNCEMQPDYETFDTLAAAEKAVKSHPWSYKRKVRQERGSAGAFWVCEEYAIEEWELDDEGELQSGVIVRVL